MAFKTFVAADVLTASEVNTYLMKQSVIVCTSGTRPSSPSTGMLIFETDTGLMLIYNGSGWVSVGGYGAWTSYTPTWTGLTAGNGTAAGAYFRFGNTITFRATFTFGSTSAMASGTPTVTTPFTMVNAIWPGDFHGYIYDASATNPHFTSVIVPASTTTISVRVATNDGSGHQPGVALSSTSPMTWTTSDAIYVAGTFEKA